MLKIGSVIDGKYKILNIVGKGGTSIVYLAMNEKVNKQWAIKEVMKQDYRDFDLERKEIEMMKCLKHPNLPAIVDVIERGDSLLIVMDYIEGQSLEDIVQEQGPLDEKSVICWAKQLCDVLDYLHTRTPPIIYRDMKPGNVMLKPDGNVMLIDFGAAREYKPDHFKDTVLLGTRGYAAPEQYRTDGQSDARTDLYSLGITIFRLLTNLHPQELCPIRKIRGELSPGLERILLKCTAVSKEERYQSAKALYEALDRYWEYDEQFQKALKKKMLCFFIPVVCSLCFAMGTLSFSYMEYSTRNHSYDACLQSALSSLTMEDEIENYRKAIRIDPKREDAYLGLLNHTFLENQELSTEENVILREILLAYEEQFQKNQSGYARFSYEAGIAYFYKYQDKSSKKHAKKYFETASNADTLEEGKRMRAKRLLIISDYYHQIGKVDKAGDVVITYKDYWEDLTKACEGNLVEEDNERTALIMYQEMVDKLFSKTKELYEAGISKEELLEQLSSIRKHLKEDFINMNPIVEEAVREDMKQLEINLKRAERMVFSVYDSDTNE